MHSPFLGRISLEAEDTVGNAFQPSRYGAAQDRSPVERGDNPPSSPYGSTLSP